jgi:hypothetical protein
MVLGPKAQPCDSQTGYMQHWVTSFSGSIGGLCAVAKYPTLVIQNSP